MPEGVCVAVESPSTSHCHTAPVHCAALHCTARRCWAHQPSVHGCWWTWHTTWTCFLLRRTCLQKLHLFLKLYTTVSFFSSCNTISSYIKLADHYWWGVYSSYLSSIYSWFYSRNYTYISPICCSLSGIRCIIIIIKRHSGINPIPPTVKDGD